MSPIEPSFTNDQTPPTNQDNGSTLDLESRRSFFAAVTMQVGLMGAVSNAMAASATGEPTVYRSGKEPIVAGQKPKDMNDAKGTRKDPDFLRSIADCKNQCLNTPASDGLSRAKEDCLSECQDICCSTYEQCTFNIVPRI